MVYTPCLDVAVKKDFYKQGSERRNVCKGRIEGQEERKRLQYEQLMEVFRYIQSLCSVYQCGWTTTEERWHKNSLGTQAKGLKESRRNWK